MELERIAVGVRPRGGWESLDLGFQMARQWWRQAWGVWFALYLPCAAVALAAFSNKFHAVVLLWWLKPAFDRAILYPLSRRVFGERTGVRATLRAARDWLRPGLLLALTLRRFDLARSFTLPVTSLEKQTGKAASERRQVLGSRMRGTAVWLTIVCLNFEMIAMFAIFALGNMLIPSGGEIPLDSVSDGGVGFSLKAITTWNLVDAIIYVFAVSLVEPFYVSAGFSLYLNRRNILEAWDMEVRLRQLGNRLRAAASVVIAALLCATVVICANPETALAADSTKTVTKSTDAATEIKHILANPDFDQYKTVTHWRSLSRSESRQNHSPRFGPFWRNLGLLLSDISQALMWVGAGVVVLLLLYAFRNFLPAPQMSKADEYQRPTNLFGLNVAPESLPTDVSSTARDLARRGQLRDALSLLYRGALSALVHRYRVVIHAGDTEGDCTRSASLALAAPAAEYFRGLVAAWQQAAYDDSPPQPSEVDALCLDWAMFFDLSRTDRSQTNAPASLPEERAS